MLVAGKPSNVHASCNSIEVMHKAWHYTSTLKFEWIINVKALTQNLAKLVYHVNPNIDTLVRDRINI